MIADLMTNHCLECHSTAAHYLMIEHCPEASVPS
jgi:hypothetical protein